MTSPAPSIPGYSDFEMVAHGSTAFVYRALQERLDRTVAVKVLLVDDDMTTADSVEKELEATVAVSNHPHIVSIIDTGSTTTGQPYIVMEYCDGGSYSQILKSGGPLGVDDVIDVGIKIGQALQAAHNAEILHRDVKPQNILRAQYGPALADFGIARTAAALASTTAIDKLTPLHASPEALLRQAQTPASDLFSLASSMWHLLGGFAPFANPEGGTDPDTHRDRVTSEAPPPKLPRDNVPEWLEGLLQQALARDPARRPASCQAFAEELQRGMYGSGGGVGTAQAPSRIGDVSNEETVFRPQGPAPAQQAPLDPFAPVGPAPGQSPHHTDAAYTLGSGVTGGVTAGGTGGYSSHLGHAVDPRYAGQLDGTAPVSSAPPISAMPHSVPPQAPVSMRPPSTPWMQQQSPGQAPPAPAQQPAFAPPVITRGNEQRPPKPSKPPKLVKPKARDERGLKPYVILGVTITVVLGAIMAGWLWLISPDDVDDLPEAQTDGDRAPVDVAIESWQDGEVVLSWKAPVEDSQLQYFVLSQRVGDDQASRLGEPTSDTGITAVGLIPTEDYCFTIVAMWDVNDTPTSEPVCTNDEE